MADFLDRKLQATLNQSYQIHSQLRFPEFSKQSSPLTPNKSPSNSRKKDRDDWRTVVKLLAVSRIRTHLKPFLATNVHSVIDESSGALNLKKTKLKKNDSVNDRMKQENLLYTTAPRVEDTKIEIPEIKDVIKLREEVQSLEQEKQKCLHESRIMQEFLKRSDTSEAIRYHYFAERLALARKSAEANKVRSAAGNYLSTTFDLKEQNVQQIQKLTTELTEQINVAQSMINHLQRQAIDIAKEIRHTEQRSKETFFASIHQTTDFDNAEGELLRLLDTRLQRSIQQVKQQHTSTKVPTAEEITNSVLLHSIANNNNHNNTTTTVDNQPSAAVIAATSCLEETVDSLRTNLKTFQRETNERMENCWQLVANSIARRNASLEKIMSDTSVEHGMKELNNNNNNTSDNSNSSSSSNNAETQEVTTTETATTTISTTSDHHSSVDSQYQTRATLENSLLQIKAAEAALGKLVTNQKQLRDRLVQEHNSSLQVGTDMIIKERLRFINRLKEKITEIATVVHHYKSK